MSTVRVSLPFPPSVNKMFPTLGARRIPSKAYTAWRAEADAMMMAQRTKALHGPVNVRIDLVPPDRRRRDADNYNKAVIDALVRRGVIDADDNRVVRMVITEWQDEGEPCVATVTAIIAKPEVQQ